MCRTLRLQTAVLRWDLQHCEAAVEHESEATWSLMVVYFSSCARVPRQGCVLLWPCWRLQQATTACSGQLELEKAEAARKDDS